MRTPTRRELEILRYLAVGMTLGEPAPPYRRYPVEAKGVEVTVIAHDTLAAMIEAGWIIPDRDGYTFERDAAGQVVMPRGPLTISRLGRDVAEVKVFVRAFADGVHR